MHIAAVLKRKGNAIIAARPDDPVAAVARTLAQHRIGAVLVMGDDGSPIGILSERDIVRAVAAQGADALDLAVEELMTKEVKTCRPTDTVKDLMQMMTLRRHRHVPVCDDAGDLVGVMSIGDAVKARLDEQAHEVAVLKDIALVR